MTTTPTEPRDADTDGEQYIELVGQLSYQAFNFQDAKYPWIPSMLARASKLIQEQSQSLAERDAEIAALKTGNRVLDAEITYLREAIASLKEAGGDSTASAEPDASDIDPASPYHPDNIGA